MLKYLEKNRILSLIITILIALEIFFYSSIQFVGAGGTGKLNLATLYHFTIFFLFGFFLLITIKGKNKINIKYLLIAFIISVIYGISDEIHQIFVPGRSFAMRDILLNSFGSLFSAGVCFFVERKDK